MIFFVLVGKGTSSREGAALAGAILEELDQRNYTGTYIYQFVLLVETLGDSVCIVFS